MTDEKKERPKEELEEEQLDDVAGGFLDRFPNVPLEEVKKKSHRATWDPVERIGSPSNPGRGSRPA